MLWRRPLSLIFLPHVLQCISLCLIFPTSLVSSFLFSSLEDELLSLLIFSCFYSFSSSHCLVCLAFLLLPHSALSSFPLPPFNSSPFFSVLSPYYFPFFFRYLSSLCCPFFLYHFASLLSPFVFLSHHLPSSSKLSAFLSSSLTFSSCFCLYPHLSPSLPASLLSLCFCACCFSILCREHSCDANYIG